jgi:type VI secretion system secreted protein Hcp
MGSRCLRPAAPLVEGGPAVASDIFAKLGDIKGESLDDKHKDEIEVFSWSWGVTNAVALAGSGAGQGKASFRDLSFTHKIDKASPVLMKACATGVHLKEATITHRKAGKGQQEFLIIKMNDVIVTAIVDADSEQGDSAETVSLAFAKIDVEYRPQKADGSLAAGIHFKYDLKANKEA